MKRAPPDAKNPAGQKPKLQQRSSFYDYTSGKSETQGENYDNKIIVECKQQEFDSTTGVIRIDGVSIEIMGASDFAAAIGLATNSEIYPLTNGHVKMALTFQDILLPI